MENCSLVEIEELDLACVNLLKHLSGNLPMTAPNICHRMPMKFQIMCQRGQECGPSIHKILASHCI